MKIKNNKLLFLIIFILVSCFSFVNAGYASVDAKIPQWVSLKAFFNNDPVEINSIANLECELNSLIVPIEGVIEVSFSDSVKSVSPNLRYNFKLNAADKRNFRFPLQFITESVNKPVVVKAVINFPKKALTAYIQNDVSFDNSLKKELLAKIDAASEKFELSQTIDFIITKKEGFLNLRESIYSYYFDDGCVIADESIPGINADDLDAIKKEIKKFEEFIETIRQNKELQNYLETNMDLVSGEDKYLKLLIAAGNYNLKKEKYDDAVLYYELIMNKALKEAKNMDTNEIFITVSNNLLVANLKLKKVSEALKLISNAEKKASDKGQLRYLYYNVGVYYKNLNNKPEAVKFLRKALNLKSAFTVCSDALKKLENY